ncbi:hypothetical protein PR202_ga27851 [Eleusine coracana subsp. coracana]|uniref:Uncharacterized protein n=1 Tax=Eleusine coracana subsp. coracana TaxID=191504 RepID=A0AAV5DHB8_ELECO|nr:hypothetical protein PR202_ga27851 [Eleusine coracana subsp. coracana]
MRWQWFKKTRANRPWTDLELLAHPNALALFAISITTEVGNVSNTLFWSDRWLHGCTIKSLAPTVFAGIPLRIQKKRTVAEALENGTWLQDIYNCGGLSWHGIREFLRLWDYLLNIALADQEDHHIWKYEASGCYSSKSAYKAYFNGSVTFETWRRLWKTWAHNQQ